MPDAKYKNNFAQLLIPPNIAHGSTMWKCGASILTRPLLKRGNNSRLKNSKVGVAHFGDDTSQWLKIYQLKIENCSFRHLAMTTSDYLNSPSTINN